MKHLKIFWTAFRNTAWDVSTDISVLKTMLAQEGLTGNKDFESVSGKEN